MCYPTTCQPISRNCMGMPAANCGCGCVGTEQTVLKLENCREHLKEQLVLIEKLIQATR